MIEPTSETRETYDRITTEYARRQSAVDARLLGDVDALCAAIPAGGLVVDALYVAVAEGDGEGWEVATNYASERRRWFAYHREPDLTTLLAAAGFEVRQVGRNRAHRDWLALHAARSFPRISGSC